MTRDLIRHTLSECLLPCTAVLAMWEAGSAAFGRADAYSDLDIGLLVRDGSNEEVWAAVDRAFEQLEGLSLRWLEPSPLFTDWTNAYFDFAWQDHGCK